MAKKEKGKDPQKTEGWQELVNRFRQHPVLFTGTILILVLTVVAFIFVPALVPDDKGIQTGRIAFGSYDGTPIEFIPGNYFAQQRDYYIERVRQSGATNSQFMAFQVWRAAFENTVIRTAALKEMAAAGFVTPESMVDERIMELPQFQENGRFSAIKYKQVSETDRLSLRKELTDEIAMNYYMGDLLGLRIPSKEKEFIKSMAAPERSFVLVSLPLSSYPDNEVEKFVETHADLFTVYHFSKITITSSEKDAKKIQSDVQKGTISFEDAAKTHSKDEYADKNGDMGIKYAYELKTEIPDEANRTKVFGLKKGEISEVVKVPTGWAFFRCEADPVPSSGKDATVLAKARSYILSFERGRMEDYLMNELKTLATRIKNESLDAALSAYKLEKKTFGPVPLNYGDVELFRPVSSFANAISELQGVATNEQFWKYAFSTPLQNPSDPFVLGDSVVLLYPTEESRPEESSLAVIDFYYNYVAGQYSEQTVRNYFLASKKLKDNFYEVFVKQFLSQSQ
ncbi:peptidylprolyl isomerase [Treponema sp. J25]|uniref:peptidylprolyl isomerase n=1 Tax=Treponema sp. J25 TaxID=2094121 RepID=UPI001050A3E7|nr:peptidylprolyl isomerase [Treponema sp. J25]TCW62355.1 peptidylprolyl isomerase [Treponema sp. J25]